MSFTAVKVYYDGSHYIGIPNTSSKKKKSDSNHYQLLKRGELYQSKIEEYFYESIANYEGVENVECKNINEMDLKLMFDRLYKENVCYSKTVCKNNISERMKKYFKSNSDLNNFLRSHFLRKDRNLVVRRVRCIRKLNLNPFNYFATFTYDDNLQTETSFKIKLCKTLRNFSYRKGWRYIGVWERSPEKKRLHFHGIFNVPEGTMPGELIDVNDYNFNTHNRQITHQNTYFNERFGRCDFEVLDKNKKNDAVAYLLKYIEKSGEKLVYSRKLPQYFVSDIVEDDVVCPIGNEQKKLLLFDDFNCYVDGEYIGNVSSDIILQMPKCN